MEVNFSESKFKNCSTTDKIPKSEDGEFLSILPYQLGLTAEVENH